MNKASELALERAKEGLEEVCAKRERQKDGLAWLDAHLWRLPNVSAIYCWDKGSIDVHFHVFGEPDTPEQIAAKIREYCSKVLADRGDSRAVLSSKEAALFANDKLRLVTPAPCDYCPINLIVDGAEVTEGCELIPGTHTSYRLVCKE